MATWVHHCVALNAVVGFNQKVYTWWLRGFEAMLVNVVMQLHAYGLIALWLCGYVAKLLHGFMAKQHVAHIHCFKGIAFFEWPGNSVVNTLNPDNHGDCSLRHKTEVCKYANLHVITPYFLYDSSIL